MSMTESAFAAMSWDDLKTEYASWTQAEKNGHMSMVANCRPDFDFADYMAKTYRVTDEEAQMAPPEVLEAFWQTGAPPLFGVEFFSVERDFRDDWQDQTVLTKHPTLGWFVVVPEAWKGGYEDDGYRYDGHGMALVWHPECELGLSALLVSCTPREPTVSDKTPEELAAINEIIEDLIGV